jgi:hypothetical protein
MKKLEFNAFDISGNNFLSRILDARINLEAMNLEETIKKKFIFLNQHISVPIKFLFLLLRLLI